MQMLALFAAVAAAAITMATRRWHAETQRLQTALSGSGVGSPTAVHLDSLSALPSPVQRYFRLVLRDGQAYISRAVIRQEGEFRSKESDNPEAGWQPFTARQVFATSPPGFVWDARIAIGPAGTIWVRDGYVRGRASMVGAVLGSIPVLNEVETRELRAGALQRYLAEAVWFPTALLPESGIVWTAMDASHARATLTDDSTTVSLEFEFGPDGHILSSYTPGRPRADPKNKGQYVTLPWGGRYLHYEERNGVQVPTESEVYWIVRGRKQPYYRGRNVRAEYDYRRR